MEGLQASKIFSIILGLKRVPKPTKEGYKFAYVTKTTMYTFEFSLILNDWVYKESAPLGERSELLAFHSVMVNESDLG